MTSTGTADHAPPPAGTPGVSPGSTTQGQASSPLPLWWSHSFPGEPQQVSQARSWVAKLLPTCAPLDDLLIVTSELATNATAHTRSGQPGGRFTVEVTWTPRTARVIIGDQGSDEVPTTATAGGAKDAYLENGRGLLLVDMISTAWGTVGDAGARWLWADVDWGSQGGLLPKASIGINSAEVQFAAMRCAHPGTSAWYSGQSGHWHARLPDARDAAPLSAPSPLALTSLLAARYPPARSGDPAALRIPSPLRPSLAFTALPGQPSTRTPPRKAPPMNQLLCTCGYQAEDPADLTVHFGEMFTPDDDVAPDGQVHAENPRDTTCPAPKPATLTCRCGVTTSFDDFDQHLLDAFAPADRIGHDGHKHAPAS